jgi:hypothetical protein
MKMSKILTTALAIAIVLLPLAAQSSQPQVKVTDLAPQVGQTTPQPGFGFWLDPDADAELRIKLPHSIDEFDIDRDPFAVARA